jgi:hypothetical protein
MRTQTSATWVRIMLDPEPPMSEYYRTIAEAVAKLERNTFDARHQLYERARNILVTTLGGRFGDSDLACERRALDAAIQRVEDESVAPNCIDLVHKNCIEVESVRVPSIERESLQVTTIEPKTPQIDSIEAELPRAISVDKTKSLLPAETTSAISEQYRRRAMMLRAIGTPRCLELATRCEKMAHEAFLLPPST